MCVSGVGARSRATRSVSVCQCVAAMPFFGGSKKDGKKIPYKSGEKLVKEDRRLTSSASNVEEVYEMKEVLGT